MPVISLGLAWTITIAYLCLGAPLCIPHLCHYCGSNVDTLGTHGLSCCFSAGNHFSHAMLNDSLQLSSANVPSRLEPTGLVVSILMVSPWFLGQMADYWFGMHLCRHLPLPIYPAYPLKYVQQQTRWSRTRSRSTITSSPVHTTLSHLSSGVCWPSLHVFLDRLGLPHCSDKSSLTYLLQKCSVAIQREDAASILGTMPPIPSPLYILWSTKTTNCYTL